MSDVAERAMALLRRAGVPVGPGLDETELSEVESRFGFQFSPDHRAFLHLGLPCGEPAWPDWRSEEVAGRLSGPVDGALFDVRESSFWPQSWGPRPAGREQALAVATGHLHAVPRLVPVFSHRYLPAAPFGEGDPVFSVYQTDVIYYGNDLADYIAHEFRLPGVSPGNSPRMRVPFWSDLAEGAENQDL